jgi:hypothetical protein
MTPNTRADEPRAEWRIESAAEVPPSVWADLDYHRRMEKYNHRMARAVELSLLVVSASIPVAATVGASEVVLGVLGGILTVVAGVNSQWRWSQNWPRHSQMVVAIQQELVRFDARVGEYKSPDDRRARLQVNISRMVQADATQWSMRQAQIEEERADRNTGSTST